MSKRIVVCLTSLALAASTSLPSRAACTLNAIAVLPIHEAGAPFVFAAKINGNPANLSVATGSDVTTLNLGSAERLNVDLHASDHQLYGVGGSRRAYYGVARKVELGGMTANDLEIRGSDLWPAGARQGLDGQFGMDLMAAYDIDLDIAGQHVIIYEADGACRKPSVAIAQPLYMADLVNINEDKQADVDVVIDDQHFRAMIDTGLRHTSMFRSAARRLGLNSPLNDPAVKTEHAFGALEVAYVPHLFKSMRIGDLQFNNTVIQILEQDRVGVERHRLGSLFEQDELTGGHEVILGADFVQKVHLWISHSSHKLIMQYPPQPSVLPH